MFTEKLSTLSTAIWSEPSDVKRVLYVMLIAFCFGLALFAVTLYLRKLIKFTRSNFFPKTLWSRHCKEVNDYNKFRFTYVQILTELHEAPRANKAYLIGKAESLLTSRGVPLTSPKHDTVTARENNLPELPIVPYEQSNVPIPGFNHVTRPKHYKSFKTMRRVHFASQVVILVPLYAIALITILGLGYTACQLFV